MGRRNKRMMKTVAIALLAAVAFAEPEAKPKADADPYLLYGGYGLGHLGYAGYYGHGLGYTTYIGKREAEAEPKADADPYLLYGGYYGHGLGYGYSGLGYHGLGYRVYGKRSADAEPKADPYLLYGGYAGHYGYAITPDIKMDSQPSLFSLSVTTFSVLDIILGD